MKPENGFVDKNSIKVEIHIKMDKIIGDDALICEKCGNANKSTNDSDTDTATRAAFQMQCSICRENFSSKEISCTPCGHLFCVSCITVAVQSRANCPLCNSKVQVNALRRLYLSVFVLNFRLLYYFQREFSYCFFCIHLQGELKLIAEQFILVAAASTATITKCCFSFLRHVG